MASTTALSLNSSSSTSSVFVAKFIDGPVVVIPLEQMSFTFDPNAVQPFGEHGTVYPSMEVRDVWGKIVVTGGGLLSPDYKKLTVPASGDGYTLTLNEGWEIRGGRVGRTAPRRN